MGVFQMDYEEAGVVVLDFYFHFLSNTSNFLILL